MSNGSNRIIDDACDCFTYGRKDALTGKAFAEKMTFFVAIDLTRNIVPRSNFKTN